MRVLNPDEPTRGDAARPPASDRGAMFRPGDLLCNRFRIVRFIARGGMGELFEAEDTTLGERVALKIIRADIARDGRAAQRFRREVQLARKVTHPNICRIFDLFEHVDGGAPAGTTPIAFVTMELLHGETLLDRLRRRGAFDATEALPIVRHMCAALAAAHEAGIIHRDFKSSNVIILDREGSQGLRAVVTDFGLAHQLGEARGSDENVLTMTGDLVGTPDYIAPEQVEGAALTPATDIYALGVVLYEMTTGQRPFNADTPMASVLQRMVGPPKKTPRQLNPKVPPVWDRAIMRCLARTPADRFRDAMAVVEALEPADELAPAASSKQWLAIAGAVVGLIAALGATALIVSRRSAANPAAESSIAAAGAAIQPPRTAVAVLGFRNLGGRADADWLSTALAEMLTTELGAGERLRTVPGENVNRMKTELALTDADAYSSDTLARIRRNLGADLIVAGSFVAVGEGEGATLRVDIRLQDAQQGQTTALVSESGPAADLLDIVSRAGSELRSRLGVAAPAATAAVRASQPGSSDAARFYAEGLNRLRRFDALGARTLIEQAIQIDPKFPLAYSALATTWSALGYDSKAKDAAAKAFELSADLPRADRLLVEGTFHEMAREWKEAIGIWQTLATFFPDDVEHALRLANAQIASGEVKGGLATIESFRRRFPANVDPRLDLMEAQAAETLSDFTRMQAAASAAYKTSEAQGARLLVASSRLRQGEAQLRSGQIDQSVKLFEEARAIYADAGDNAGVARALNSLASAISDGPDTAKTRAWYDEGLRIARTIGKQDLVARFLNNIAIQERRAGRLQESLKMNQEALQIRREIGDVTNTAVSLNNIGNVLLDLGDLTGASRHYEESAALSRQIGDRRGEARALYNAAEAFAQQGELTRSRATYETSLKIRRSIEDPASVATSLFGLGALAVVQGDLPAAKQSLNEALDMDRKLDRRRPMAYSLYQLGEIALLEGKLADARKRHQEALDIRTALGEQGTAAESRTALAVVSLEEGKPAEAEAAARQSAAVFAAQKAPGNEAVARATLALALATRGQRDEARREADRAQALVKNWPQVMYRLPVATASARVTASTNPAAALQQLNAVRADAERRGIPRVEFDARRAAIEIETRRGSPSAARMLADLRRDAGARGFTLYTK